MSLKLNEDTIGPDGQYQQSVGEGTCLKDNRTGAVVIITDDYGEGEDYFRAKVVNTGDSKAIYGSTIRVFKNKIPFDYTIVNVDPAKAQSMLATVNYVEMTPGHQANLAKSKMYTGSMNENMSMRHQTKASAEMRGLMSKLNEGIFSKKKEQPYDREKVRSQDQTRFDNYKNVADEYVANHPLQLSTGQTLTQFQHYQNNDGTFGVALHFDGGQHWFQVTKASPDNSTIPGDKKYANHAVVNANGVKWEQDKDVISSWLYKALISIHFPEDQTAEIMAALNNKISQTPNYGWARLNEHLTEMNEVAKKLGVKTFLRKD